MLQDPDFMNPSVERFIHQIQTMKNLVFEGTYSFSVCNSDIYRSTHSVACSVGLTSRLGCEQNMDQEAGAGWVELFGDFVFFIVVKDVVLKSFEVHSLEGRLQISISFSLRQAPLLSNAFLKKKCG